MCTLVFSLPSYLVDDAQFIQVHRPRDKSKTDKEWIADVKDDLVDEYGADDPDDFEFVCYTSREISLNFKQDLS